MTRFRVQRPAVHGVVAAVVAVAFGLWTVVPAEATYEVDHRYVVLGYVRDAAGQAVARTIVRVVREKTGLAHEVNTEADGFYLVIVHLHDEDVLEPLRITAGRATLRIQARFNARDPRTPRGTSVDIVAGVARERPEEFAAELARYVGK